MSPVTRSNMKKTVGVGPGPLPKLPNGRTPLPNGPIRRSNAPPPPPPPSTTATRRSHRTRRTRLTTTKEIKRPWKNRLNYGIDRVSLTERELAKIRSGYPSLLGRKSCFKKNPGEARSIEITMEELAALWKVRKTSAEDIATYERRRRAPENRRRAASLHMAEVLDRERDLGVKLGRPDSLKDEDKIIP